MALEDVSKKDLKKNQADVKDRVSEAISMNQLELDLSGANFKSVIYSISSHFIQEWTYRSSHPHFHSIIRTGTTSTSASTRTLQFPILKKFLLCFNRFTSFETWPNLSNFHSLVELWLTGPSSFFALLPDVCFIYYQVTKFATLVTIWRVWKTSRCCISTVTRSRVSLYA